MFSTLQIYYSSKVKKTCLVYSKPFIVVDILRSVSQHHGIIWPFIRFRAPSFLQISFGHLYTGVNELVLPPIVISYVRLSASVYRFRNLEKKKCCFNEISIHLSFFLIRCFVCFYQWILRWKFHQSKCQKLSNHLTKMYYWNQMASSGFLQ